MNNTINEALHNLLIVLAAAPQDELIGNLNNVVDNLNELGINYTITLKTS